MKTQAQNPKHRAEHKQAETFRLKPKQSTGTKHRFGHGLLEKANTSMKHQVNRPG
jgi:hypothetical protein